MVNNAIGHTGLLTRGFKNVMPYTSDVEYVTQDGG